jgi:hypothetical protein
MTVNRNLIEGETMRKTIFILLLCAASLVSVPTVTTPNQIRVIAVNNERENSATKAPAFTRIFSPDEGAGRWNPCELVLWKIRDEGYTQRRFQQTVTAFRQLRRATGLNIKYAGVTTAEEIAASERGIITVSFVDPSGMDPSIVGDASVIGQHPVLGGAIIRADVRIALHTSFDRRFGYVPVLLHELGHAVGLGHSGDRRSLMYPELNSVKSYNRSDLAGLTSVGSTNGCITPPGANPVAIPTTSIPAEVPAG